MNCVGWVQPTALPRKQWWASLRSTHPTLLWPCEISGRADVVLAYAWACAWGGAEVG